MDEYAVTIVVKAKKVNQVSNYAEQERQMTFTASGATGSTATATALRRAADALDAIAE